MASTQKGKAKSSLQAQFKKLIGGAYGASEASNLLDDVIEETGDLELAAELYRLALARSGEKTSRYAEPGERFIPPSRTLAPLVAKDVYPYLRPFMSILRDRNNVWLVGCALEAIVTGGEHKDVATLVEAMKEGLAAYSDQEVADFIEAMTVFEVYDPAAAKRRKAILKEGLKAALDGRTISLTKRSSTFLGKLGLAQGKKPPKLPKELPKSVPDAVALLQSLGVKLRKPKDVPEGLPAALKAVYEATSSMDPYLTPASKLESLRKSMAKWLADAEIEEGIPLKAFSPEKSLVVFGKSAGGDFFFLDPQKYGEIVFRFVHDEDTLLAEASSLGAFLTVVALEEWAEEVGVDDALGKLRDKDRKEAKKAFSSCARAGHP